MDTIPAPAMPPAGLEAAVPTPELDPAWEAWDAEPEMPSPEVLAAETVPLLAALVCAHRDGDLSRVTRTIADQDPQHLQALVMTLTRMVPPTTPLPNPAHLADLLADIYTYAPITKARAVRNRAELADAIGVLPPPDETTAVCSRCEQRKPHSEFHRDASTPTGFSYRCKTCSAKLHRAIRARTGTHAAQPARTGRAAASGPR
ncbi:hypothetical protein ACQPZ8_01715 [Actinomadura nitritigenes]|uniref:hypothetical protein n=1 Tax=Actinomadura nitritigenes TaxID=134602 RepID=UPI003D90AE28